MKKLFITLSLIFISLAALSGEVVPAITYGNSSISFAAEILLYQVEPREYNQRSLSGTNLCYYVVQNDNGRLYTLQCDYYRLVPASNLVRLYRDRPVSRDPDEDHFILDGWVIPYHQLHAVYVGHRQPIKYDTPWK